jgi:hypothetical protein
MSALERGAVVRVVALTLANGARHPMLGLTGVVLEVHARVPHPVRVYLAGRSGRPGRTVMLAHDELQRVVLVPLAPALVDEGERVTAVPA